MSRLCVPLLGYASLSGNLWSTAATPTNYCRTLHVLPCDNDLRPQPRQPASVSVNFVVHFSGGQDFSSEFCDMVFREDWTFLVNF